MGPPLDETLVPRLEKRLNAPGYAKYLQTIDQIQTPPQVNYAAGRKEVLAAHGTERVKVWLKYHIMEPRFDNTYSLMPNLGLTERQSAAVADYLYNETQTNTLAGYVLKFERRLAVDPLFEILVVVGVIEAIAAVVLAVMFIWNWRKRRKTSHDKKKFGENLFTGS